MIEKQNRIIIVDDQESELQRLGNAFLHIGVGCRTIKYTNDYNEPPLNNVRIAFFDMNLDSFAEINGSEDIDEIKESSKKLFNDLSEAIKMYISTENGPYVLIFWTKTVYLVELFKEYIRERQIDIPSPLFIFSIDKFDFQEENVHNLPDKVLEIINSDERIKFLFDIQENCRKSGEETINLLYEIVSKKDQWGDSQLFFEDFDLMLSKIAASTLGCDHAKDDNQKAIYEGLLPLINYKFLNSKNKIDWEAIMSKLNSTLNCHDLTIEPSIQYQLNSLFHIESSIVQNKDHRGSVVLMDKLNKEILNTLNIADFNEWSSKLISIKSGNQEQQNRKNIIIENTSLIAIEISAACDFTNKKERINKYVLGILCNNLNHNLDKDLNLKGRPESCYHLGGCCFSKDDNNYNIFLNLNYIFSAKVDDARLGQPIFNLKKEIMDMLGNKYASHISRIGITTI